MTLDDACEFVRQARELNWFPRIGLVLAIVGALNCGLWGLFQFDLVASIFDGQTGPISRVVYSLVELAGVCLIAMSLAIHGRLGTNSPSSTYAGVRR